MRFEGARLPLRRSEAATCPKWAAIDSSKLQGRQGAAIVQVHVDPVPADGLWAEQGVAPFVVQPGCSSHGCPFALEIQCASGPELWLAVVAAGLFWLRPLSRPPPLALQEKGWRGGHGDV